MKRYLIIIILLIMILISTYDSNSQASLDVNKWKVRYEKTGNPSIVGYREKMISVDIDVATKEFLNRNKGFFNINTKDLEVVKKHSGKIKNKNLNIIIYKQNYNNLPVFGSYILSAAIDDNIVLIRNNFHDKININTKPSINEIQAFNIVKQYGDSLINYRQLNSSISNIEENIANINTQEKITLGVFPKDKIKSYEYFLTYEINLPLYNNHKWTFYVDANSGNIIEYFDNVVYEDVSGYITGMIYPEWPGQAKILVDFEDEFVNISNYRVTPIIKSGAVTNELGNYIITSLPTGDGTLATSLYGRWAKIIYYQGLPAVYFASVNIPSVSDINWQSYDPSYKQEASNVFYHTNVIHDYASSIGVPEMDFKMKATVNIPSYCNAYYVSRSINFFAAGGSCDATSLLSDVVYHEYAHGINDELITVDWPYQDETGNMNEGLADYLACTINNNACQGEYFYYTRSCLRRCDTTDRYPQNYNSEPHSGAQIISAIFWELRQLWGKEIVDPMLVNALRLQPASFSQLLEDFLIVDDDNQNLLDGTPHITTICNAFYEKHGIYSGFCTGYTINPLAIITNPGYFDIIYEKNIVNIVGTVYPSIGDAFQSYTLEYGTGRNPSLWNVISTGTSPIKDGILGAWNIQNLQSNEYTLRLTVVDSGGQSQFIYTYYIDKEMMPNWPKYNIGETYAPIVMEDLDNDGDKELIFSAYGMTNIYRYDGNRITTLTAGDYKFNVPAIGDLDNDGFKDIVIYDFSNARLYVYYDPIGASTRINFINIPRYASQILYSASPVLYDLNNDKKLEIVYAGESGKVYVLNSDLTTFNPNWPKNLDAGDFSITNPAIGDLDNDGIVEIVILTIRRLYIFRSDGTLLNGFPKDLGAGGTASSSPVLADIDNNGDLEIFVASPPFASPNYIYGFNHDGTNIAGWPVIPRFSSWNFFDELVIADVNNDKKPEIIAKIKSGHNVIYSSSGTEISGYNDPEGYYPLGSSVVADVDNDGKNEIIYLDSKSRLVILESSSSTKKIPIPKKISPQPATIGDVDNDGKLNIAAIDNFGTVYLWNMSGGANNRLEWPQLHHDIWVTGNYNLGLFISKIENTGDTPLVGYLNLKIQKETSEAWQDYQYVQNKIYQTIQPQSSLDLASLWNTRQINLEAGNYRAVAEFTDASGNILQSTNGYLSFSVMFPVLPTTTTTSTSTITTSTSTTSITTSTILFSHNYTFYPTDDSFISNISKDSNYGVSPYLSLDGNPINIILLKFNVSFPETEAEQATRLHIKLAYNGCSTLFDPNYCTLILFPNSDNSWDENTVTWNNQPFLDGSIATFVRNADNTNSWYTFTGGFHIFEGGEYTFAMRTFNSNDSTWFSKESLDKPWLEILTITRTSNTSITTSII